jgi:hypothetical protein
MSNGIKKCSKCGQVKSLEEFHRNAASRDGRQSSCKDCRSLAAKSAYTANPQREMRALRAREWRAANPDKRREAERRWRLANPDKRRQTWADWAAKNKSWIQQRERLRVRKPDPEARRKANRKWRQRNRDAMREQTRTWRRRNRQRAREQVQRRRAIKAAAATFVLVTKDLARLTDRGCVACGLPADSLDHMIPLSRGGSHGIGNLTPMCRGCNSSKGAKTIAEWRKANDWLPLGSFPQRKDRADGAA